MKIAIFSDVFLDASGGIVTSVRAQKNELENLGHEVYLFTPGFWRKKSERQKFAKKNIFIVPSCKLFFRPVMPIARRPAKVEKWILKNYPEVKAFDVFHVHYEAGCSIAGIRLARKLGIRLVQTMHGREDIGVEDMVPAPFQLLAATLLNKFHSWYLPHYMKCERDDEMITTVARSKMWSLMINHANQADVVLTPSKHFGATLKKYGVTRPMDVVSNGVEDKFVTEKVPVREYDKKKPLEIIWNSRLSKEKRIMEFLEALRMVKTPYHMAAFGDGFDQKKAERYVKKYKMNVKIYGPTERDLILKEMNKSHLGVLVSYHFDNQPMTLVEAEVRGLPVLICDPNMKEVVPEGGYIFAEGPEPEKLAAAIDSLADNPGQIAKMSKVMIEKRVEKIQSKQVEKLIKVYQGKN